MTDNNQICLTIRQKGHQKGQNGGSDGICLSNKWGLKPGGLLVAIPTYLTNSR